MTFTNYNSSFAITPTPAPVLSNSTITTNITDNLNSITENVSSSIKSTIEKVMSDTLDGMMEDTIGLLLKNTTQSVTNDNNSTEVKFEPKIPSGIDITQMPMENKLNPSYEREVTVS